MLRALRVSRLTICPLGQPEKAIGLEPQIEPWLAIYNHTACLRQKSMGLVYASAMNLRKRKITDPPLYELGWMAGRISSLPPVAGEVFLLTSSFIELAECDFANFCDAVQGHKEAIASNCPRVGRGWRD